MVAAYGEGKRTKHKVSIMKSKNKSSISDNMRRSSH